MDISRKLPDYYRVHRIEYSTIPAEPNTLDLCHPREVLRTLCSPHDMHLLALVDFFARKRTPRVRDKRGGIMEGMNLVSRE